MTFISFTLCIQSLPNAKTFHICRILNRAEITRNTNHFGNFQNYICINRVWTTEIMQGRAISNMTVAYSYTTLTLSVGLLNVKYERGLRKLGLYIRWQFEHQKTAAVRKLCSDKAPSSPTSRKMMMPTDVKYKVIRGTKTMIFGLVWYKVIFIRKRKPPYNTWPNRLGSCFCMTHTPCTLN